MTQDKFILSVGAQVGGCLVDGLGDGVMVQAPGLEKDMLRSVCFGLLQVNAGLKFDGRTRCVPRYLLRNDIVVPRFELHSSGAVFRRRKP